MKKMSQTNARLNCSNCKKLTSRFFLFSATFLVLLSCQKVVNIDLNSSAPQIVIEGNITNQRGPYYVRISRTVNFSELNVFPVDTTATVKIGDTLGNTEQLVQVSPGVYATKTLRGVPGRTYNIEVLTGGIEYRATSSMPDTVKINTLKIVNDNEFIRVRKEIEVSLNDPPKIQNFYRFIEMINGNKRNNYSLQSDRYQDGKLIRRNINLGDSLEIKTGDTITIFMHSIDKATYDYFRTLRQVRGGGGLGFLSASPANPIINFNNNALGYFSAYSITKKSIVAP